MLTRRNIDKALHHQGGGPHLEIAIALNAGAIITQKLGDGRVALPKGAIAHFGADKSRVGRVRGHDFAQLLEVPDLVSGCVGLSGKACTGHGDAVYLR